MPFSRGLPDPGVEPTSLAPPALAGGFFTTGKCGYKVSLSFSQGILPFHPH